MANDEGQVRGKKLQRQRKSISNSEQGHDLYWRVFRALLARALFATHALTAVWRVTGVQQGVVVWVLSIPTVLIFLEGAMRILIWQGRETRWFCLSVFLYLCSVVPSIWFLQLDFLQAFVNGDNSYNESQPTVLEFSAAYKVTVDIPITPEKWILMLEQTLLVVLIIGRWVLPKGRISRDHLSQLLLVWLAMGCDIVELFDVLKEQDLRNSEDYSRLTYLVLLCWTVSLGQFPLVLTGKSRKARGGCLRQYGTEMSLNSLDSRDHLDSSSPDGQNRCFLLLLLSDINFWGLVTTTLLQDGPFLALRLYLLVVVGIQNYTMVFFTCKNSLILFLQMYRLYVICTKHRDENRLFKMYIANFKDGDCA